MNASGPGSYLPGARVAVVVSGWPRLSETFALNELLALRDRGLLAAIYATKQAEGAARQPANRTLEELVTVLPPGAPAVQGRALADHAARGGLGLTGVHGYFAHAPAEVARESARILDVPFGFSSHALDARKVEPDELLDRGRAARTVVACNPEVAATLSRAGLDPVLVPHGVDTDRFQPGPNPRRHEGMRLLAVGRLVEKKGFPVLLAALARLDPSVRLTLVGDGPLRDDLCDLVGRLGLDGRVTFLGSVDHDVLPDIYREADVVVVPSIVDSRGDRDGLPNVVLEAMATGCAIVASAVAAIPTAIESGVGGLLVPPGDDAALAVAIDSLAGETALRRRLGDCARAVALESFALQGCAAQFCGLIARAYQPAPARTAAGVLARG